jgi:hypothetical protein
MVKARVAEAGLPWRKSGGRGKRALLVEGGEP